MRHMLLLLVALAPALSAQWTSDPAANTVAVDRAGEQTQPKLAVRADGGFYLAWFDNDASGSPAFGYDVYLQRFDSAGNEQWAHNGVLVADRGFSSTTDYDLAVDSAGNALVTFRDDRLTGTQVTAAKVDPAGTALWGATGVQLTNTVDFVANPEIVGTSDGNVVVAWVQGSGVHLRKLDGTGAPLWSEITLLPGAGSYSTGDLDVADAGGCILSLVHQTGSFSSPRHLLAQKYDAAGAPLWGAAPKAVFDGGSLQFGNFPDFVEDGAGGAVFGWYSTGPLESWAQRIDSAGNELFPHNGVALSTNAALVRVSPAVAFDPATQATYLFATELNALQTQSGVTAQKFDATGARQWGATGKNLVALAASAIGEVRALVLGNRILGTWTSAPAFGQDVARGALLDPAGNQVGPILGISTTPAVKFRFQAERSAYGHAVLAWRDERGSDPHVYLQDVLPSGALGGRASTLSRNGSNVNVTFYTPITDARLGTSWSTSVSHAHHPGATATVIVLRTAPLSGPVLGPGQVLVAGTKIASHALPSSGSADVHSLPIPVAIELCGITLYTQAAIVGGAGLEAGNALDITLGL